MTPGAESTVSADSTAGLRSSVGYRADVDGLRALAVIVVVAFHVGVPGFSGGFAGVDVFFAISGYLITGILWRSVSTTGSVDWRRFLVRRARRIIPLFAVVTLVSLLAACWLLVPDPELRSAGQSAAASSMFLANIFFYLKTYGYFAADVERLPLLHMWSLAVEEQFYLVWPIVIGGAGWLMRQRGPVARRRMVLGVVVGTTLVSFGAAWRLVGSNQSFAFYMMPTRAWELSAGGLLALYSDGRTLGRRSWSSAFLGAGGGLLLVAGFISLGSTSAFPGPRAVPFVFGTVLLISAGEFGGRGSPTKVLSWRPLALVGRLSYGWYLFHWPALVFVRIATAERNLWRDALIGVGTLGLAWMTHHLVERPLRSFRDSSVRVTRHTLVAAGAAIVVLGALGGIVAVRSTSLSQVEISPSAAAAMRENRTVSSTCADRLASEPEVRTCSFGSSAQQTLVLLGDSHALALMPAARTVADNLGLRLKVYWSTGCPYVGAYTSPPGAPSFHACTASNVAMNSELATMSDVVAVLVTGRASSYVGAGDPAAVDLAVEGWTIALQSSLQQIEARKVPVLVIHDVPHFDQAVPECSVRRGDVCTVERRVAEQRRAPSYGAERAAVAGSTLVSEWDPFDELCVVSQCAGVQDHIVLYRDEDHLSEQGAALLAPALERAVKRMTIDD